MVRLVRLPMDELHHRRALRQKYFEDPSYCRWSDILPGGMDDFRYMSWSDHHLFDYLLTNQVVVQSSLTTLDTCLKLGHKLPINWSNFYAYFDEQLNDPKNRYLEELTKLLIHDSHGDYDHHSSVKGLLDKYRDERLAPTYDII